MTLCGHGVLSMFVLLLLIGSVNNIPRAIAFFEFDNRGYKIAELQAYGEPLAWLENNLPEESVIWTNESIGSYIPILTKHYTLYQSAAVLHAIPQKELEERYLLWRSLEEVTLDTVQHDFSKYVGAGASADQPAAVNRWVWLCNNLSRFVAVGECPQKTDGLTLRGPEYFEALVRQFDFVKADQDALLDKYSVDYLVIDTLRDALTEQIPESAAVYNDGRFLIFPISAL